MVIKKIIIIIIIIITIYFRSVNALLFIMFDSSRRLYTTCTQWGLWLYIA